MGGYASKELGSEGCDRKFVVYRLEPLEGILLTTERRHYHVSGVLLLYKSVHGTQVLLLTAEVPLRVFGHDLDHNESDDRDAYAQQRQMDVHERHHDERSEQRCQSRDYRSDALVHRCAQCVDVVGHTAHHITFGRTVEVRYGYAVHLPGNVPAEHLC